MDTNLKDTSNNKKTIFIILIALLVLLAGFGSYSLLHKNNKISYKNLVSSIDDISEYLKANSVVAEELSISEDSLLSEEGVIRFLNIRGIDSSIIYRYLKSSEKVDNKEVSSTSSEAHPEYISYYTSTSGDTWAIYIVNNETFAINISESSDTSKQTILTENGYILIYDEASNSYIKLIPNDNVDNVFKVKEINKDTLDAYDGTKESIMADNSDCNPIIIYESNLYYTYDYDYDDSGRIVGYTLHSGESYTHHYTISYDDNGDYSVIDDLSGYAYKFNSRGLWIENIFNQEGWDTEYYSYTYDENGNVASMTGDNMDNTYTYEYDEKGKLITMQSNSSWPISYEFIYDDNEYLIKMNATTNTGDVYTCEFIYTFNDDGTINTVAANNITFSDNSSWAVVYDAVFPLLHLNDKAYNMLVLDPLNYEPLYRFYYGACD